MDQTLPKGLVPENREEQAQENFEKALALLRPHFPDVDTTKIVFKKMAGNDVGKAHHSGVEIDPIMLMHPVARLAHILAHELTHLDADTDSEGLVEAYLVRIGLKDESGEMTEQYNVALNDFYKVADVIGPDRDNGTDTIYEHYKNEDYEEIYQKFIENGGDTEVFWAVFPELYYDDDGETSARPLIDDEEDELIGIEARVEERVTDVKNS